MRVSHRFLIALSAAALLAGTAVSQRPDNQLSPLSVSFLHQGQQQYSSGKFDEASNSLESALAADPRNRAAFVVLARVAQKQKLFSKSIRLTNKALALEPNDLDALEVQGEAMVELGAKARAQATLAKLQKLCPNGCRQVAELSSAINRGPTVASATPPAAPKSN